MDSTLLQRFHQLTSAHTGLHIRDKDREQFRKALTARMQELKLGQAEAYYQLLESGTSQGETEWKQLIAQLTNGESYFFRDKSQIALLKHKILPELIERNRRQHTLRLWSAGCSTGEEPYSLAMLLHELLPARSGWKVLILGTDINEAALHKARQGVYSQWSFRMVEAELHERYFHDGPNGYELDPEIRRMVTLQYGNLRSDAFPSQASGIHDMDLIICRNVLIYFDGTAVGAVLRKFEHSLCNGGYLMTGHAELNHQNLGHLRARMYPESMIYQHANEITAKEQPAAKLSAPRLSPVIQTNQTTLTKAVTPPVSKVTPIAPRSVPAQNPRPPVELKPAESKLTAKAETKSTRNEMLQEAALLTRNGAYRAAIEKLTGLLQQEPSNDAALYLAAQAYANLGQHEQAANLCRQAIGFNAFAAAPYHLLAHIAEEQGSVEEAKTLLKKVIYLAPEFVAAYIDLGAVYGREGDAARARQMRLTARQLLHMMPPDTTVASCGNQAASTVMQHLDEVLKG